MTEMNFSHALQGKDNQPLFLETEGLTMKSVNDVPKMRLQARPQVDINTEPLEQLLNVAIPAGPREKVSNGPGMYWLAPNDWLVIDYECAREDLRKVFKEVGIGGTIAVVDVSDAYNIIELSGRLAVTTLAEGCSVDLDSNILTTGHYALTRLQNLPVILHRSGDQPKFRILVDRSVARYLWDWLAPVDMNR